MSFSIFSRPSLAVACAGATALMACQVDDRPLLRPVDVDWTFTPKGGEGGTGGEGATAGEDTAALPDAGDSLGGAPNDEVPRVVEWSFDLGTQGWAIEPGARQSFSELDADDNPRSGSLTVTNTISRDDDDFWMSGTSQCVPVRANRDYDFRLDLYMARNQAPGSAGFGIEFFNAPDCQGLLLDIMSALSATTGEWVFTNKPRRAPSGTKSALIRLVVTKLPRNPPFVAQFDNVRFAQQ